MNNQNMGRRTRDHFVDRRTKHDHLTSINQTWVETKVTTRFSDE
jgi:hypothetical protein